MAREVNILGYLPPVLHEIKELVQIANVENPVLESVWQEIENTLNNQFVISANEKGAARYEKMLKLNVPATDTLATRQFRILTRFQEQAPYTNRVLKQLLDSLLGAGQYELKRDVAAKTLSVKIELTVKGQFDAVVVMLERITPQNMVLTVELRYNQYLKFTQYTHAQLSAFTHRQLREEVLN
ncbi:putative phage tail protein [Bacillus sp. S/N-304-OC-R1]|uniref:putative phage tail protein n=1 Tax=Bacillus sp. S/N-304-OC-R1 TaxID=2758034 RepID=UPI001C8E5CF2|nr:putative phage tail protein [Bacillus sp. S/N-304-OC-R1]MBY0122144.1 DUF2313 domain-containing protein [Bacillus sp. S/N-304-OC-R1]